MPEYQKAKEICAGRYLGRPKAEAPNGFASVVDEWRAGKITTKDAMERTGLKRSSFYKLIKEGGYQR